MATQLEVPPTIEALMAARLDQLPGGDRAVLERGSVIGTQFGAGEVAHLSDEGSPASVRPALMALVRRDMLRPDADAVLPLGAEDEGFRFRHQLIRDGAYAAMSKAERARLHERYAGWLEELPAEQLRQLDEVVGYHLEQAYVLWTALGGEPGTPDTASRAASHLGAAGLRAGERSDFAAAANLLARAVTLLPPADPRRIAFLPQLAGALILRGRFDEAQATLNEAIEATNTGPGRAARVRALVERAVLARLNGATEAERKPDLEEALAIAQTTGDPAQLARVQMGLAMLAIDAGRLGEARREVELAVDAAQRSGDSNREGDARGLLGWVTWAATSPASDIDRVQTDNIAFAQEHGRLGMKADELRLQAVEEARRGRLPEARRLLAESVAIIEDLGDLLSRAGFSRDRSWVEFLAGDPAARERVLREGYEQLSAMGERGVLSTMAADLADALVDLGRLEEAEAMCTVAEEAGAQDDAVTQVGVRLVRGRLAAARSSMDEALASVAEALALADEGEYYDLRTLSRLVSAQVLLEAGRIDEARSHAEEVVDLARVRGDVVFEARARDLIERMAVGDSISH
jgi:tetratricopeptide (TPR) repeat protein